MDSTQIQTVVFHNESMFVLKDQVNNWLWSRQREIIKVTYFTEGHEFYCVILAEIEKR